MQRNNGEQNEETPRPSFKVKRVRSGRENAGGMNKEAQDVWKEGKDLEELETGNRLENLQAAMRKYQHVLLLVAGNEGLVQEITGIIARVSAEIERFNAQVQVFSDESEQIRDVPARIQSAPTQPNGNFVEIRRRPRRSEPVINATMQGNLQRARSLYSQSNGDRERNLGEAIRLYQVVLDNLPYDNDVATLVKREMSQAIDEQAQIAENTLNAPNMPAATQQALAPTLNVVREMLTAIRSVTEHNREETIAIGKKGRDVEGIIDFKAAVDKGVKKIISVVGAPPWLEVLVSLFLLTLIFLILEVMLLPWFYNSSSWQRCPSAGTTSNTIISTSPTLSSLLHAAVQQYKQTCGVTIALMQNNQSGSLDGIDVVDNAQAAIGAADIMAYNARNKLYDDRIAVMPFVFIVDKNAGIHNLTTQNIIDIYSGAVSNWRDVCYRNQQNQPICGNDLPINVIERPANSDVRAIFEQYVLGGSDYLLGAAVSDTDSDIVQYVNNQNLPGAIGYVSLYAARQAGITPIPINNIMPTLTTINNRSYTFWSVEHLYTLGQAMGVAQKFIYFMHTDDGTKLIHRYGFFALNEISSTTLNNHIGQV